MSALEQADGFAFVIHGDTSKGAGALGLGGGEHVRSCTCQSTVSLLCRDSEASRTASRWILILIAIRLAAVIQVGTTWQCTPAALVQTLHTTTVQLDAQATCPSLLMAKYTR